VIQIYTGMDSAISIEKAFRDGHGLLIPWSSPTRERIEEAMAELAGYLARFPATPSFGGINQLDADRQTLWVASTGLGKPFHVHRDVLVRFDGDAEGGERGIEALKREKSVSGALKDLKLALDDALKIAVEAIGLNEDLPPELNAKLTVRYRAIRYAPVDRDVAGIGLHPDGNVLSALVTDSGGLVIKERSGVCRPPIGGTVLMPGSILYRWSNGYFKPTFHSVEIRRGDRTKFTIVAFLNFPDQTLIPRSARRHQLGFFLNNVQRHKEDDMNRAGDLAPLWSSLDRDPT
jgi:2OG-Fe(II) oxygenase superfamily